ncbi:helix-turn-helix transcriptional regulator [Staphylococcus nepalensis]|uniref:helix-turn-helix domain-containing protein n=1 Tax=Staphylococcus nepalensis TaxID=214473 RepID=UPI0030179E24
MENEFRVILARKKLKISDVFRDTGIAKTTLYGISEETTKHPSATTILKLCEYLEVTPNEFFGIKKTESNGNC